MVGVQVSWVARSARGGAARAGPRCAPHTPAGQARARRPCGAFRATAAGPRCCRLLWTLPGPRAGPTGRGRLVLFKTGAGWLFQTTCWWSGSGDLFIHEARCAVNASWCRGALRDHGQRHPWRSKAQTGQAATCRIARTTFTLRTSLGWRGILLVAVVVKDAPLAGSPAGHRRVSSGGAQGRRLRGLKPAWAGRSHRRSSWGLMLTFGEYLQRINIGILRHL